MTDHTPAIAAMARTATHLAAVPPRCEAERDEQEEE
jgi:hypothetical protein